MDLFSGSRRTTYSVRMQGPGQDQQAEEKEEPPIESTSIYEGENIVGLTERNQFGDEIVSLQSVKSKPQEKEDDDLLDLISKRTGFGEKYNRGSSVSAPATTSTSDQPPQPSHPSIPFPPFTPNSIPKPTASTTTSKEFYLSISPSILDHKAYISRQGYYGPFNPDTNSPMAADLERRAPLAAHADLNIRKPELYLRARHKRENQREQAEKEGRGRKTLREMWEDGMRRAGKEISSYDGGGVEGGGGGDAKG